MMTTLAKFRQQPDFGCSIDHDMDDWLIAPISQNRDSDHLTKSNWDETVKALGEANSQAPDSSDLDDPPADDFQIVRFNHWAVGWVENILIRPGSKCEDRMTELAARLADYPVLNEEDFSQREWEDYLESWNLWGCDDFIDALGKEFEFADRVGDLIEAAEPETVREFYESLTPSGEFYICEGSGVSIRVGAAADRCTRSQLAAFLRSVRKDALKPA